MRNILGDGVLAADLGDAYVGGFAGFGEGVVAGVEVLALLWRFVRYTSCIEGIESLADLGVAAVVRFW